MLILTHRHRGGDRPRFDRALRGGTVQWLGLLTGLILIAPSSSGCKVLDETTTSAVSAPGLALLAAIQPAGAKQAPPDLTLLRPVQKSGDIGAGDVLDCTVWDLYEPGEPHTFPLRIGSDRSLDLPLAGSLVLTAASPAEIEQQIERAYQQAGVLQQPRVVVRPLEQARVTVRVSGAVFAPGDARVTRDQATVYAAIAQAGGLKPNAGRQIGVARAKPATSIASPAPQIRGQSDDASPDSTTTGSEPAGSAAPGSAAPESATPGSATADQAPSSAKASDSPPTRENAQAVVPAAIPPATGAVDWYDLSHSQHVETLRDLRLEEGDEVIVSAQVAPIRILGSVDHPGPVPTHSDRPQTVSSVLSEAGGIRTKAWPVVVTLLRPPSEGQRARQYSWTLDGPEAEPDTREQVRPGDLLYVAPTTGTRIKRAVSLHWMKPAEPAQPASPISD